MADVLKNIFGRGKKTAPVPGRADAGICEPQPLPDADERDAMVHSRRPQSEVPPDLDFADFAAAPEPIPKAAPSAATLAPGAGALPTDRPLSTWYKVHERHSLSEFKAEGFILAAAGLIIILHILGSRSDRFKARAWSRAHAPVLAAEFALVGFGGVPSVGGDVDSDRIIKEKSLFEFATYASGRQNSAFMDVKLTLCKRFNPVMMAIEFVASLLSDMFRPPADVMEAFLYPFDGKEDLTVPSVPGSTEVRAKDSKSTYEGFVWAVVNKECMQRVREDRYDVTLASTNDHPKLPNWLTVMSENSKITDLLLTPEIVAAVTGAGESFEYLIVTDQPAERPKTVDETNPRKRLFLKYRLPPNHDYEGLRPLLTHFIRLPDMLVRLAHFRPEVTKKIRATREAMIAQIKKTQQDESQGERLSEKEKERKAKRKAELKGLDAKAQKKYLGKEKEKELRKSQKRMTVRG